MSATSASGTATTATSSAATATAEDVRLVIQALPVRVAGDGRQSMCRGCEMSLRLCLRRRLRRRSQRGRVYASRKRPHPQRAGRNHELDEWHQAVEVDAFVESAPRNQPWMRHSVGQVEADVHDNAREGRCRDSEKERLLPTRAERLPAEEPDRRSRDQRNADRELADLDRVAPARGVRDHAAVEEAAVPGRCALRLVAQLGAEARGEVAANDLRET